MRRLLSGSALALVLGATASLAPSTAQPQASADTFTTYSAKQSDALVDGYGVGIHLAYLNTPYVDAGKVADELSDLGVRHVRDDLYIDNPRQYAGISTVASRGIKFDLITGNPSSPDAPSTYMDTVANQLPQGSVESVEGSNEWDLFSKGSDTWAADLLTRQKELYQADKANPATADIPVLAPALAFRWNYAALGSGSLTPYADYANAHMYPGGYQPSNQLSTITQALRATTDSSKPLITTEAGYNNAMNTTSTNLPVPEDVAGVYTPRILLEHLLNGDKRVYTYELLDEFPDLGKTDVESNWGLLHNDFSPKPAFTAMKNLLALANDPGPSFTPQPLQMHVTGFPGDGKYMVTQKRNGQYVVYLWRNASVYDPVTKTPQQVTPANVTLQVPDNSQITTYRPTTGAGPVSQTVGTSTTVPVDGAVTAVTIGKPPAPAPQAVTAKAGANQTATVSWTNPTTSADVSGVKVTRLKDGTSTTLPATATSFTDTGLTNGTSYAYSVQELSPDGNSDAVATSAVTPGSVPPAPKISSVTAGVGSVTGAWGKVSDANAPVTGYEAVVGSKSVQLSASTLKTTVTGLTKGAKYRIAVRAKNALGWGPFAYSAYVTTKK